jgi:hypothetical protein
LATDRLKAVQFRYSPRCSAPQAMPGRRYGCRWAKLIGLSEQIRYIAGRLGRRRFQYCGQLVPPTDFRVSHVLCQGELEFPVAAFTPEGYCEAVTAARRVGTGSCRCCYWNPPPQSRWWTAHPPRGQTPWPWPNAPGRRCHLKTLPRKTTGSAGRGRSIRRRGGRHKRGSISSA